MWPTGALGPPQQARRPARTAGAPTRTSAARPSTRASGGPPGRAVEGTGEHEIEPATRGGGDAGRVRREEGGAKRADNRAKPGAASATGASL